MDIAHLREFEHLSQSLSFKKTARHFFVSTSVISRHVAALEEELGVKLFERGSNKVSLTAAGQAFLKDATIILHDYENALSRLAALDKQSEYVLHVGYLHNAARPFILDFMLYMNEHYPNIDVVLKGLKFKDLYSALDNHRVDLNFMLDVFDDKEHPYKHTVIYEDRLYAVTTRENPLAKRTGGIRIADLQNQKLILPDPQAYPGLENLIRRLLAGASFPKQHKTYVDLTSLYLELEVQHGIGFSSGFNRITYSDNFVFLPILDVDTHVQVSAFWRDTLDGYALNACREAIDSCRKTISPPDAGVA